MTAAARELARLRVRYEAIYDAKREAAFAERTGETWKDGLDRLARITNQRVEEQAALVKAERDAKKAAA